MKEGAVLAISRDYYDAGVEAGLLAAKVLRGADPAKIPFSNTASMSVSLNESLVERYGLVIPEYLRKAAQKSGKGTK
jgi:putative ABC transport system substrate-binding protein